LGYISVDSLSIFVTTALWNRAGHYIFALWFLLLSSSIFFLFSSRNLSGRRVDVYYTSTHGVVLVRIYNAGLKCGACGSLAIQDAKMTQKIAISFSTIAQLFRAVSSQLRRVSTIEKNLLSSNISSTCPHNMVNFGPLTAEIGSGVCGTPAFSPNFNGFRV